MKKHAAQIKDWLLNLSPPLLISSSFLLVILIGALLLTLPVAQEAGRDIGFLDALYTATSATCVTGLVIYDTGDAWTWFGELVIMFLIQIGGLGLITLTTFFLASIGRKSGLKAMMLAKESMNTFELHEAISLIRNVVKVVFWLEFAGAILLSAAFIPTYGVKGIYFGIFHAISAFNNAGFDVLGGGRGFIEMANRPLVLYTVEVLIACGGLGFIVWQDIWNWRKTRKLRIHTRIVLIISVVLWVSGAVFIYLLERGNVNTLGRLPTREAIDGAVFLSVNARTAGFSSLNTAALQDVTKVFVSMLMFIGAASGSTAGGIKVNTLGVLLIAMINVIQAREKIVFQRHRISVHTVMRAFTIVLLAGLWLIMVTFLMTLLHPEFRLVNALFESTSAFGTVGLSIGMTTSPSYGTFSKILHIMTMFVGRIGPMTFAITLSLGPKRGGDIIYPEGKIVVG